MTRYKFYECLDDNEYWELDFDSPKKEVWQYFTEKYAEVASEYGFDFVRVYDGVGITGRLLFNGTGTGTPVVTSLSGPLTVQFVSDGGTVGAGFNATISCVAQPVCAIGSAGGYAMCQNGTVPGGQGLTAASCGAFNSTRILDFPGAAFTTTTASAASAPAGATSVLTVPALPVGATVSAVRLLVHGIEPTVAANSWSNEVRVELSGALSGLPQTSGALTGTAGTTAAVALGTYVVAGPFTGWPAGGTVTAKLSESSLDGGNPDAYIAHITLDVD